MYKIVLCAFMLTAGGLIARRTIPLSDEKLPYCTSVSTHEQATDSSEVIRWTFPLPRTHTGILLGNGTLGTMVWGKENVLRITVGRADFWDHQGGYPFEEQYSYQNIRQAYAQGRIDALYDSLTQQRKEGMKPSVLPIGRIEVHFDSSFVLKKGQLNTRTGILEIQGQDAQGMKTIQMIESPNTPAVFISLNDALPAQIKPLTAWEFEPAVEGQRAEEPGLKRRNIPQPSFFKFGEVAGWVQGRVVDPPLAVGYRYQNQQLVISTAVAKDSTQAKQLVAATISQTLNGGFEAIAQASRAYWLSYWAQTPTVRLPDDTLQLLYDYGMYKFGAITNPDAVPITLQGPWIEEYQMPPWLSDYHFNINVQMCYWPAFAGNHADYLLPLFNMLARWTPKLEENARIFMGEPAGIKLSHAVDDRGTRLIPLMNGGYLDPGSTLWPALMMHRYFEYTQDTAFLQATAFPFMQKAFRSIYALLEEEGDRLVLPLVNSLEFYTKSEGKGGLGKNPTFQLLLTHQLASALQQTATLLGQPVSSEWKQVLSKLPLSTIIDGKLAVWEGQPYDRCHRHFSHLAGITPFDGYDTTDSTGQKVLRRSYEEWVARGTNCYAGWSIPWAVMLHNRFGNARASVDLIHDWRTTYVNEGYGTMHDPVEQRPERMQIEAGLGMAAAILDMLAYEQNDVIQLFQGIPADWQGVSFQDIVLPKGILVSADKDQQEIQLTSRLDRTLAISNPWDKDVVITQGTQQTTVANQKIIRVSAQANQPVKIQAQTSRQ